MIDVITLAIIKKWIQDSGGGSVTPEEIQEAVDKYLEEHPVQPTPIDDTLTIAGEAADAKAVGDAIQAIFEMGYLTKDDLSSITDESISTLFN